MVAGGSYLHVVRRSILGMIMLLLVGLIYVGFLSLGALVYAGMRNWIGIPIVLPGVTGLISVVAGIFNWKLLSRKG
jgi:hypothetical protein